MSTASAMGVPRSWRLVTPIPQQAELVAGWSRSAGEAAMWVSRAEHPFPPGAVTAWWRASDVQPWLLLDGDGIPVAYGEIWDDAVEDEVELARLIVDPNRRRQGIGRRLVDELVALAKSTGREACFLRVAPDNGAALALYRAAGFHDVGLAQSRLWNHHQPVGYVWLQHPMRRGT